MRPKKKKITFGFKQFFECTPQTFKRVGNALLGISSLGSSFAFVADDKRIGMALLAFGALGKFLTKFFSEDRPRRDDDYGDDHDESDEDCEAPDEIS